MGVNADFQANFGSFLSALQEADTALADFGKGADKVGTQLQTMTDKWAGVKVIQQANELVKTVNDLGGATTLTTNEQAKLNAQLTEAIAKYQAIGQDVPPEMQKLADQTKGAATTTEDWVGNLQSLASAFGIAFSVDAVVKFAEQIVASAQALQVLSLQTGINTDTLQTLTAATAAYGVTTDDISRALFTLQQRIAGGDQSVVVAYARMGISLDDLRGKNADELFLTTERALGQLSGATADVVAKDLYGKLGLQMIAFSKNVDTAMDAVAKVPKVSSEANKALADLGDATARNTKSFTNWVSDGIGGALIGLDNLHKALDIQGGNQLKVFAAGWEDWFQSLVTGTPHAEHLATVFDDLNKKTATDIQLTKDSTTAHNAAGDALVTEADAATYMATIRGQSVKALTDWQTKDLEQLAAMNQLDALHATGIGVTVQQLDKYKAGLEAAKKASEDLAKQQQQADAIAMDQYTKRIKQLESITQANLKAYSFDGQIAQLNLLIAAEEATAKSVYDQITSEKDRMKIIEDLAVKRTTIANQMMALEQKHTSVVNDQVIAELQAQAQLEAAYGRNVDGTIKVEDAAKDLQVALDNLHAKKQAGIDQTNQENVLMQEYLNKINGVTGATNEAAKAADEWNASLDKLYKQAGTTFATIGESIKPVAGAVDSVTKSVDKYTGSIQLAAAATSSLADLMDSYFPSGSTGSGAARVAMYGGATAGEAAAIAAGQIISLSSSGIAPPRAAGGPVTAGQPYLVGEQGPELFVPSQSGSISPNGAGVTVHNTFHIVDTESNIAQRVAAHITRSVMRSTRLS